MELRPEPIAVSRGLQSILALKLPTWTWVGGTIIALSSIFILLYERLRCRTDREVSLTPHRIAVLQSSHEPRPSERTIDEEPASQLVAAPWASCVHYP